MVCASYSQVLFIAIIGLLCLVTKKLLPYQRPSSSTDCARELFKGSNGLASLVDCTQKNFFGWECRFFMTDVISEVVLGHFGSCCLA